MNMYNALVYMVIARFMISVAKLRLFFESSISCLWKIRHRNKNENSCKSANYETAGSSPYGKITSPPAFSVHKSGKRSSLLCYIGICSLLIKSKNSEKLAWERHYFAHFNIGFQHSPVFRNWDNPLRKTDEYFVFD